MFWSSYFTCKHLSRLHMKYTHTHTHFHGQCLFSSDLNLCVWGWRVWRSKGPYDDKEYWCGSKILFSPPLDSLITALVYQTFLENTLCFTRLYPQGIFFFFFLIQFNTNALAMWGQWFSLPLTPMSRLLLSPSYLLSLHLQPESILLCGWLLCFIFFVFYFE